MPCESCTIQFSMFKRKRVCSECDRYYCSGCLRRGGGAMCAPCRLLSTRPLSRQALASLKVRDLQCFLHHQNVSTRACVEKEDLISLVVGHVNSSAYRRRQSRPSPFCSLKGFTNNINELLNSAFDIRTTQYPREGCFNSAHTDSGSRPEPTCSPPRPQPTTSPYHFTRPAPPVQSPTDSSTSSERRETADCYEIEDLDEGWEFVSTPAEPLPNDSEVLLAPPAPLPEPPSPHRAASLLDLRAPPPSAETGSLRDEPFTIEPTGSRIELKHVRSESHLERLSVRQLKELLAINRVEYRGCLERADLLQRAKILWRDTAKYPEAAELSIEESCKICMAAPLECVLLECGHMAACTACAKQLAECPICRQYVVRAVRVFRS